MSRSPVVRLRKICLALPEAHEVETWDTPTFRISNKIFAMFASAEQRHGQGRPAVWMKAARGRQGMMVRTDPTRFFAPPYVGPKGWLAIWLDDGVDWDEVAQWVREAYCLVAPRRLARELANP